MRWVLTLCLATVVGCQGGTASNGSSSEDGNSDQITVCLLPKKKGIPYFTSCADGAREAAEELGDVALIYDGPVDADARQQAEMIENWIVEGVDAICVSPNAPDVLAAAMRDARDSGIAVITWDADARPESRSFFVNQATPQIIGTAMVDAMIADLGGPEVEGDVVIISSDATSDNQNSWIAVMEPALEQSNLNLVTIKYPGENAAAALADTKDVIRKYPHLKGIFGISSVAFPAAAEAVEQMGKTGQILVTGLSTPNPMRDYVNNGTVKTVVLWNTEDLGYLTVHVARAAARRQLQPGATSFRAGRLGELEVEGDQVLLGDILLFTKDNIDQYDF